MRKNKMRRIASMWAPLACAVLLAACSTAPVKQAQWIDPALGAQSGLLRGAPVLVACDFVDTAVRQICQDELVQAVRGQGGNPVIAPPGAVLLGDREPDAQLLASAAALGARAVVVMTLTPVASATGSGVSLGLGGFSFGGGGGVGVGLSAPIGGDRVLTTWAANGRVSDARSGRLLWTTSLSATSGDLRTQLQSLAGGVATAARESGLF